MNYVEKTKWTMQFVEDPMGLTFHLPKAPNAFYRFMQRVFLGFVWKKL
jgi:hypothetical protein